jgi:hypothetical protein
MKRSARVAYSFLFFLAIVISWIMRDFARPLIEKIPCELVLLCSHLPCLL